MVLACSHSRSLQLLARFNARTEFKILEHSLKGGVEAGRAHHCSYDGLEHQNYAQMKFVRNHYSYADRHNPIAHVSLKSVVAFYP